MSRTKEHLLHQQEVQMEYYSWFMDFIYDNLVVNEIKECDINNMERSIKPLTAENVIVSEQSLNTKEAA